MAEGRSVNTGSNAIGWIFKPSVCWTLMVLQVVVCGCQGHGNKWAKSRHEFFSNELATAHVGLTELSENRQNQTVAELDLAMVELFQGQPKSAEQRLRKVRQEWSNTQQMSLAEESQAFLTDDNAKAYTGEVYEQMTLGVMLTLCSLMSDGVDAESYTLQTLYQQQALVARFNADRDEPLADAFGIPPVVPYLRGVMREATLHDQDDALRMYRWTAGLLPDHPQVMEDLHRAEHGNHSHPGHGVVYIMALVGRGPYKVERSEVVTQAVMLQTEQILSLMGKYRIPPSLAPIRIPVVAGPPRPFDVVGIRINGQPQTTTLPLTDFEQLAVETYSANQTQMMARTVARRIVKKGAIYTAKSSLQANDLASFALDAVGVAWEATETADIRCWGLLPREIQIARLELPVGRHQLTLEPVTNGHPFGTPTTFSVAVGDAQNTFVLGFWPDQQQVGELLISGHQ